MGLATGVAVWLVWHFTKPECTATAAANGICNPGIVARYITVEILLQSGGAALAAGALKGGYDRAMMRRMINEEREARQAAEQHLAEQIAEQRKRNDETFALLTEMFNEIRSDRREEAERRQQEAERRQQEADERRLREAEERQIFLSTQQALLDTITRLARRSNGNEPPESQD